MRKCIEANVKNCFFHNSQNPQPLVVSIWWVIPLNSIIPFLNDKFFLAQNMGFPGDACGKEPDCQCRRHKRRGLTPWVGKIPWTRTWQLNLGFLPGESHGQRSLVGYSPWRCKQLDVTEGLSSRGIYQMHLKVNP